LEKGFGDLWSHISWSPSLQLKYPNLLILVEIARIQCVSIASCERAFSIQNSIKSKVKNNLKTKHLESVMRIALEGPDSDSANPILIEAIDLWKIHENLDICIQD